MKPDPNIGSEEEFEELFGPIEPITGESLWEFKEVEIAGVPAERVWTIVDDGGVTECWYAEPGFHIVNVIGYMVTERPWTDPVKAYYWYFDSRDPYIIIWSDGEEEVIFADTEDEARENAFNDGATIVSIALEVA